MDQDRRDAEAWAQDWAIRRRNKKILAIVVGIAAFAVLIFATKFISIKATRSTFSSEEEMKAALQGRYAGRYQDIVIDGDDITLTYYEITHYDIDYARQYGYSEYGDSIFDDYVVEWDYKHGVIKMNWMQDIIVDKNGNIEYYSTTLKHTDEDPPVPFDKALLDEDTSDDTDFENEEELEKTEEQAEEQQESIEKTEDLAASAGVVSGN